MCVCVCVSMCLCLFVWVFVCGLWECNPGNMGGRWHTRLRVSPDWLCHLLISCHGELVRPSLLEVCPWGPAALPRWACAGFVCRGLWVCVCVCASCVHYVCVWVRACDLANSRSRFLHPHPSPLWPPVVLFLALKELLHHSREWTYSQLICRI